MACATTTGGVPEPAKPVTALDLVGGDAALVIQLRPDRYLGAIDRMETMRQSLPSEQAPRQLRRVLETESLEPLKKAESLAGILYVYTGHFLSWWDPNHPSAFALFQSRPQDLEVLADLRSGEDLAGEGIGHRWVLPSGNPQALMGQLRRLLEPLLETREGGEIIKHGEFGTWWFGMKAREGHVVMSFYQTLGGSEQAQQAPAGTEAWMAGPQAVDQNSYTALRDPQVAVGLSVHMPSLNRYGELMGVKNTLEGLARVPKDVRGEFIGNAVDILMALRSFRDGPAELDSLVLTAMGPSLEVMRAGVRMRPYAQGLWDQAQKKSQGAIFEPGNRQMVSIEFSLKDLLTPAEPVPWLGNITDPRQLMGRLRYAGPWLMPGLLRAPVSLIAGIAKHPVLMAVAGPMGLQPAQLMPGRFAVHMNEGSEDAVIALELQDAAAQIAERQLSENLNRAAKAKAMLQEEPGPMDLVLLGPIKADFNALKRRVPGNQGRLAYGAGAGAQPRCSWRYVATSGAIQGGCALDDQPLAARFPLKMAAALMKDDRPADGLCRQTMAPLLSDLAKSAPDEVAQQVTAVEAGLKSCLSQSPDLAEVTKGHWRRIVKGFVDEAKGMAAQPEPTASRGGSSR